MVMFSLHVKALCFDTVCKEPNQFNNKSKVLLTITFLSVVAPMVCISAMDVADKISVIMGYSILFYTPV